MAFSAGVEVGLKALQAGSWGQAAVSAPQTLIFAGMRRRWLYERCGE